MLTIKTTEFTTEKAPEQWLASLRQSTHNHEILPLNVLIFFWLRTGRLWLGEIEPVKKTFRIVRITPILGTPRVSGFVCAGSIRHSPLHTIVRVEYQLTFGRMFSMLLPFLVLSVLALYGPTMVWTEWLTFGAAFAVYWLFSAFLLYMDLRKTEAQLIKQ